VTDVGRSSEVSKLSVHRPIDFVLIEVEGSRLTGHADDRIGDFAKLGWARSDLLNEDDMVEAGAAALEAGKLAVLIGYKHLGGSLHDRRHGVRRGGRGARTYPGTARDGHAGESRNLELMS
jgi:hypothetical protein